MYELAIIIVDKFQQPRKDVGTALAWFQYSNVPLCEANQLYMLPAVWSHPAVSVPLAYDNSMVAVRLDPLCEDCGLWDY